MIKHVVVAHDKTKWCAVPANNGGNGPIWQWGSEILIGFTQGEADFTNRFHQVNDDLPQVARLARSLDGGESWQVYAPANYQGAPGCCQEDARPLSAPVDFTQPGFVMRVEGYGYHGNAGQQWFYSLDKGVTWQGAFTFGALLGHPELKGKQFTSRTGYLVNGPRDCYLFLSVRGQATNSISDTDKVFLAQTTDGGLSFQFVAWVVPPSDPSRAVMPAPVRLSPTKIVTAVRRRNANIASCWIDCYASEDNGASWRFLSRVGETGGHNGNPPAMVGMADGRLCCVFGNRDRGVMLAYFSSDAGQSWGPELIVRDLADFQSVSGTRDFGYPRLFQRPDGRLVTTYFWCSPAHPETHIEATLFDAP